MTGLQLTSADAASQQAAAQARAGAQAYADGDLAGALGCYFMALGLQPNNPVYVRNAVALIGVTSGYALPPVIKAILGNAAQSPAFNCQPLASAVASDFIHDPLTCELLDLASRGGEGLEAGLAGDKFDPVLNAPMLRAVLQRAVVTSPRVEMLLTALRRHALERTARGVETCLLGARLDFFACLAAQCFNTEYAYFVSPEEEGWLGDLFSDGPQKDLGKLMLVASYQQLFDIVGDDPLPDTVSWPAIDFVFRQQVHEPRREAEIRAGLKALTPIDSAFSEGMQAQYERFPYPRWFVCDPGQPRTFRQLVEERFPGRSFGNLPKYNANVLIPGCGTGHQIAQVASMLKNPRITAVDLSRTSLAYARRKLDEHKIKVHRFGQADLLALESWVDRFDYIECMGVLHHLERPEAGLKALMKLLQPRGLLRLGLYSERARSHVVAARKLVAQHGFPSTAEGVRAARKLVTTLSEDHPVREVMESQDFYSIAGLHDLIFNIHECRYTPLGLKDFLDAAGLEFLGFDHPDPSIPVRFRERFPDDPDQTDLANWEKFDIEFPDTFSAMYQFWCRPVGTS